MPKPLVFSRREREVIDLLFQGRSNKQIAQALGLADRTVEFHLSNIYARLGAASRTEAVLKLTGLGLWIPAGPAEAVQVRESAVEKDRPAVDNGGTSLSLRRQSMKNIYYIAGTLILTTALVVIGTLIATSSGRSDALPEATPSGIADPAASSSPTGDSATHTPAPTVTPETATSAGLSTADVAQFVGETYPDWTNIPAGTSFTKTWTFRNAGTTTWTTGYSLQLTASSHPLGQTVDVPAVVHLPKPVAPGETVEISVVLQAPSGDGTYTIHWQMENADGLIVSGDGYDIWVTFTVGESVAASLTEGSISLELTAVEKAADTTNVHICAQYPDAQDWNPWGVTLAAGSLQAAIESYSLDNAKSPSTGSSSYRCFTLGFPVGMDEYGDEPVRVTIASYRVDASTNLEANCARAKQQLAAKYPGLDFTCGPAGFFYSGLVLPGNLSTAQADTIIMDALEQAITGPWILDE